MKRKFLLFVLIFGMFFITSTINATTLKWTNTNGNWKFYKDGILVKNKWEVYNGNWYHFDKDGIMETGWHLINNKWYSFTKDGQMRTNWYFEDNKWYYLGFNGDMKTGWYKTTDKNWSYFKSSGEMVSDTLVKASDKKSYLIDSNGYTLYKLPKGRKYKIKDLEYYLQFGNDAICIVENSWIFDYSKNLEQHLINFSDNVKPNEEIKVENIISNFKNYKDKFYLGNNGQKVLPTPEFNGMDLKIEKIDGKLFVKNDKNEVETFKNIIGNYTIIDNRLYYLVGNQIKTGYHVLNGDGMIEHEYAFLTYANENGEIIKARRLSDYRNRKKDLNTEIDGFFGDKIIINSNDNFSVKIVK